MQLKQRLSINTEEEKSSAAEQIGRRERKKIRTTKNRDGK